jgi:hypothetical protein
LEFRWNEWSVFAVAAIDAIFTPGFLNQSIYLILHRVLEFPKSSIEVWKLQKLDGISGDLAIDLAAG